jgi:hypothetical protein
MSRPIEFTFDPLLLYNIQCNRSRNVKLSLGQCHQGKVSNKEPKKKEDTWQC